MVVVAVVAVVAVVVGLLARFAGGGWRGRAARHTLRQLLPLHLGAHSAADDREVGAVGLARGRQVGDLAQPRRLRRAVGRRVRQGQPRLR